MYAIATIKGLQYQITEGDKIQIPSIKNKKEGDTLTITDVLLTSNEGDVKIGTPTISGANIEAKILGTVYGEKVRTVKHHRRKRYVRTKGHKQAYTSIQIEKIAV